MASLLLQSRAQAADLLRQQRTHLLQRARAAAVHAVAAAAAPAGISVPGNDVVLEAGSCVVRSAGAPDHAAAAAASAMMMILDVAALARGAGRVTRASSDGAGLHAARHATAAAATTVRWSSASGAP